ncbi:MAG TPA: P-II family nitrogen regulator [Gemmatimonadaceae bacterium]|nr:P-II family nitrogen regulator [Gemmatimonadaceae bacterium]
MSWCKLTAIVRRRMLEGVVKRLETLGVPGLTVIEVRGFGEYKDLYHRDWTVTHARLEIFTERADADRFVQAIVEVARTGEPGDGMVAILPVDDIVHIRSGGPMRRADAPSPDGV